MKFIALETSTETLSAALFEGPECKAELSEKSAMRHAELLVPLLKRLLDGQGWSLDQVEGLALGLGPGSFTGLRVGLAFAKGLALGRPFKLAGVGSMAAWAFTAAPQAPGLPVSVLLDGRNGLVFRARYACSADTCREESAPALVEAGRARSEMASPTLLTGDLPDFASPQLGAWLKPGGGLAQGNLRRASAAAVGRLAWEPLRAGGQESAALEPLYLRPSQAEAQWDTRKTT